MRGHVFGLLLFLGAVPLLAAASLQDEMRDLERRSFQAIQRSDGSKGFQIRSSLRRVSAAASDMRTGPTGDPARLDAYIQARNDHLALLGVAVDGATASSAPAPDPQAAASLAYPTETAETAPAPRPERRKKGLFSRLRSSLFGGEEDVRDPRRPKKKAPRDEGVFTLDPVPPQPEDFMRAQGMGLNPYPTLQQYWVESVR